MCLTRQVELPLQDPPSRVLTRCTRVLHKRQKCLIFSVGNKVLAAVTVGLLVLCPLIFPRPRTPAWSLTLTG